MRGTSPTADADLARRRPVVDAFLAASRDGDFAALLDPDVVLRHGRIVAIDLVADPARLRQLDVAGLDD